MPASPGIWLAHRRGRAALRVHTFLLQTAARQSISTGPIAAITENMVPGNVCASGRGRVASPGGWFFQRCLGTAPVPVTTPTHGDRPVARATAASARRVAAGHGAVVAARNALAGLVLGVRADRALSPISTS